MQHATQNIQSSASSGRSPTEPMDGLLPADPASRTSLGFPLDDRAVVAAVRNWFGDADPRPAPDGLHRSCARNVATVTHLNATSACSQPDPCFVGEEGEYPIDVTYPGPALQARLEDLLPSSPPSRHPRSTGPLARRQLHGSLRREQGVSRAGSGERLRQSAHSSLVRSRAPPRMLGPARRGRLRHRLHARCSRTCLLITTVIPTRTRRRGSPESSDRRSTRWHLVGELGRPPLLAGTVFFRLPLAIPHLVWLALWTVFTILTADRTWVRDTLHRHPPAACIASACPHALYSRTLTRSSTRRESHSRFVCEQGGPSTSCCQAGAQSRWKTGFRSFLAIQRCSSTAHSGRGLIVAAFPHVVRRARDRRCARGSP